MGKAALIVRASGMLVHRCAGCRMGTDVSRALPGREQTVVTPEATAPRTASSSCRSRRQGAVSLPARGVVTMSCTYRLAPLLETRNRWSTGLCDVSAKAPTRSASPSRLSVSASILVGIGGGRRVNFSAAESRLSGLQGRVGGRVFEDGFPAAAGDASAGTQTRRPGR